MLLSQEKLHISAINVIVLWKIMKRYYTWLYGFETNHKDMKSNLEATCIVTVHLKKPERAHALIIRGRCDDLLLASCDLRIKYVKSSFTLFWRSAAEMQSSERKLTNHCKDLPNCSYSQKVFQLRTCKISIMVWSMILYIYACIHIHVIKSGKTDCCTVHNAFGIDWSWTESLLTQCYWIWRCIANIKDMKT